MYSNRIMSRNVKECIDFSTGIDELLNEEDNSITNESEENKVNECKTVKFEENTNKPPLPKRKQVPLPSILKKQEECNEASDTSDDEDTTPNEPKKKKIMTDISNKLNSVLNKPNHSTVWYLRLDRTHVYYILVFAVIFIILTLPSFLNFYKTFLPFCFNETGPSYTSTGAVVFGCVASLVHAILTLK